MSFRVIPKPILIILAVISTPYPYIYIRPLINQSVKLYIILFRIIGTPKGLIFLIVIPTGILFIIKKLNSREKS